MEENTITYTAKPLRGGWYAIYKNWIPTEPNKPGVGYSHPKRKQKQRVLKTKNPKKVIFSLEKQIPIPKRQE
ncbi:TPA: hypothetical protein DCZ39_09165 [Patescibacteria group bacterium]|nr:hypothetical protein [Candidatus Gracilibacteria bacterium]